MTNNNNTHDINNNTDDKNNVLCRRPHRCRGIITLMILMIIMIIVIINITVYAYD